MRVQWFNSVLFIYVFLDPVYSGENTELIQEQHNSGSFVCTFDVFYYPFDEQWCTLHIEIADVSKELVAFTYLKSDAVYKKDKNLAAFTISNLTTHPLNFNESTSSILQVIFSSLNF